MVGHKPGSPMTEAAYDRPVPENQADMVRGYGDAIRAAFAEKKKRDKMTQKREPPRPPQRAM